MTKDELFEKLKPLAESFQNSLASKQHVFNSHLNLIDDCKREGISNQLIVEAINHHLPESDWITVTYLKNLIHRSKSSKKIISITTPPNKYQQNSNVTQPKRSGGSNFDDYLEVCFGSENLAQRAIDAGISIETIKQWECPNTVRLSTVLSNFIQNK